MPISLGEPNLKRRKQIIGAIAGVLILSFVIAFWSDIVNLLGILINFKDIIFNKRSLFDWATPAQANSLILMSFTCGAGFLGVFLFWLILLASQAILPVDGFVESYRTAFHLLLYMLRLHGPAVFVRDGEIQETKEDRRPGPGLVVVDYNSAVVLESSPPLPGITRMILSFLHTLLIWLGLADPIISPRTAGPGVVFTARGENIRSAVDLRKQFRSQPNVSAYTRDGIEVSARVFSIFTIGQPAEILQVTYTDPNVEHPRAESLRVVSLERVTDEHMRVTRLSDELDPLDREEIHRTLQFQFYRQRNELRPYSNLPNTNTSPEFDSARVFAAAFSQARAEKETTLPWSELPARVTSGIFREILSHFNFDQLYQVGQNTPTPMVSFRERVRLDMRNNGVLSYRFLQHHSHQPLEARRIYLRSELMVDQIRPLTNPKVLRDRGIKVITASFGDILPVNDAIYKHRLETWRATWQRDTEIIGAEKELEAMGVRGRERAAVQQDIIAHINSLLNRRDISQEVLALRVFQALETLAVQANNQKLLPDGTLDSMKAARDWLLPGPPPPLAGNYNVDGDVNV
jgi:hypothetical protein